MEKCCLMTLTVRQIEAALDCIRSSDYMAEPEDYPPEQIEVIESLKRVLSDALKVAA